MQHLVDAGLDFWLTTGRFAAEFERRFAQLMEARHAILVNSGSSANLLAVSALTSPSLGERALKPGDEVITVAAGFPTTVNPIFQNGLVPVFVDIELPSYGIDVAQLEAARSPRTARALGATRRYLAATQRADGAWWPLWFGNQAHPEQANPAYGTAKVVRATRNSRGAEWLLAAQAPDGGIASAPGIGATIEETAVAVEALAEVAEHAADRELAGRALVAVGRGLEWLITHTDGGKVFPAAPIGLYFAKLWYDEALYPLAFTVTAFERSARLLDNPPSGQGG
jgi:hypothetical protein